MPGPAIHHMIADRLKARIASGTGLGTSVGATEYAKLQALLSAPQNLPYLFMGCQGPDPFFFNVKDLNPIAGKLVAIYNDLSDFLDDFEKMLLDAVPQPVLDALAAFEEAANEVITDSALLSEIKQTFEDLGRLMDGFSALLSEALKKFVTEFNLYDLIDHPYRDGAGEGDWWWFDAMHYRKVGRFAAELLERTRDMDGPTHLYALGYLTHVAADTVGHAFVNLYSGGPYRSHGQRHKTGENYQDVFELLTLTGVDWNYSKLHALINFEFTGVISATEPPENPRLPDDLANLLAECLNAVFQEDADPDPDYGSKISPSDVDDTYRLWYRFMRGFTETSTIPPPVSYSFTAELREVWEKVTDNLEEVGDFLEDAADTAGDFGVFSIFIMLAALIAAAVLAAIAIADAIAGAITTLGTATIRYAACLLYEQVYNAFQMFRLAVTLNGLGFPMREHLAEPRLVQFISPAVPDTSSVNGATVFAREPLLRFSPPFLSDPLGSIFHQERHLFYPLTTSEKRTTTPAPPSYLQARADFPAFGRIPLDRELLQDLVDLQEGSSLSESDLSSVLGERTLGNAMELTAALYERWFEALRLPDFNLDSDRGYGYLCWLQSGDKPNTPSPLVTNTDDTDPTEVKLEVIP